MSSWPDWTLYALAGVISAASFFALYHIAKAVSA